MSSLSKTKKLGDSGGGGAVEVILQEDTSEVAITVSNNSSFF